MSGPVATRRVSGRGRAAFDALRDGLVNGEGAAALLLEAERAPAPAACRSSPACSVAAQPSSRAAGNRPVTGSRHHWSRRRTPSAKPSSAALREAGRTPADVGFVVAHGLSTIEDDRIEAQAIRETLGDVPVTAPKSYFGYLGAASGALEMALALLAFQHGQVPPTLNYEQPGPAMSRST